MSKILAEGTTVVDDPPFWPQNSPDWTPRCSYRAATVCSDGHPQDALRTSRPTGDLGRCGQCGEDILANCQECGIRIRGIGGGADVAGEAYMPPEFCDECGAPHPWASREALVGRLQNLLKKQSATSEELRRISADLDRLRDPGVGEHDQIKIVERVRRTVPGLIRTGTPILQAVLTSEAKRKLGLP